ncbi:hypothetical protein Q7P35_010519 [Cladosporium inversicolor]
MSHLPWSQLLPSQRRPSTFIQQLQNATLLGHPHEQASPQETEPFWQQHSEIAYPHARFYPELELYTECPVYYTYSPNMDHARVVIGSKSRYARLTSTPDANFKPRRPRETVNIYLQDEFVGEISLGVLVRFSKLAKATYPRPAQPKNEHEASKESVKASAEPEKEHDGGSTSGSKEWAEMAEQSDSDRATKSQSVEAKVVTNEESSPQSPAPFEPPTPKNLVISVPGAWVQPNLSIAKHILTWMVQNRRTRNDEPLLPLTPVPLAKISLKILIDTFTGVLAYDLAPFPRELRHEILTRLTQQPAKVEQIRYLYEHLPVDDPILNRMVTSYFEHSEADNYTQAEIDAIWEYVHEEVDDDGELERHLDRVRRSRVRKQSRVTAMEKLREGFEDFAGPMAEALIADTEAGPEAPKDEGDGRRRRNRRDQ